VKCPSCNAEIADKAIVCYRCGAPTTATGAVRRKDAASGSRGRLIVLLVVLAGLVGLLLFTYLR